MNILVEVPIALAALGGCIIVVRARAILKEYDARRAIVTPAHKAVELREQIEEWLQASNFTTVGRPAPVTCAFCIEADDHTDPPVLIFRELGSQWLTMEMRPKSEWGVPLALREIPDVHYEHGALRLAVRVEGLTEQTLFQELRIIRTAARMSSKVAAGVAG